MVMFMVGVKVYRHGDRGAGRNTEHRDAENLKAVPRIFHGVKIAPLPPPVLFPRAAAPCGAVQPVPGHGEIRCNAAFWCVVYRLMPAQAPP
jgi:hypothetical protein